VGVAVAVLVAAFLLVPRYVSQLIVISAPKSIGTAGDPTGCDPGRDVSLPREVEPHLDALQIGTYRLWREVEPMGNHCWLQPVSEEQGSLTLPGR